MDSLVLKSSKINGEWQWIRSQNGYFSYTSESEHVPIKLVISNSSTVEIYQDGKLKGKSDITLVGAEDKTLTRNSSIIWRNYIIAYKFASVEIETKYFTFTKSGTFNLWNDEFLIVTDHFTSGSTTSTFKKVK